MVFINPKRIKTINKGILHINIFKNLFFVILSKKENFKKHFIGYVTKTINKKNNRNTIIYIINTSNIYITKKYVASNIFYFLLLSFLLSSRS